MGRMAGAAAAAPFAAARLDFFPFLPIAEDAGPCMQWYADQSALWAVLSSLPAVLMAAMQGLCTPSTAVTVA